MDLFKNREGDGGWGDGEMGRWGDESIFLPAREATRFAIGRRGVSSAGLPILVPEFSLARSD
ncbi:hypothetical protein [Okeania sp. KiyG1]|uniref:hypothetical protein n=1 Tax=Okeania sp. KiyG1 TaxID=2720165 RepID=UPI00192330D8|nr:hypothetical protein [Okeania sp. KiyG1]